MIDLHSHTWLSDGHLGPAQLIARAESVGVRHLAITDHDCIAAHTQIQSGAVSVPQSMDIISGVEISTVWENQEIHIIGLLVETENSNLNQLLESQQERRRDRAGAIDKKLQRAGICGLSAYLSEQPCQAVGRNHVADFLISQSVVSSKQQAFTRYLAKRGNAYVSASWCTIDEAVAAITAAGGVAVLAHPDRYPLSKPKFKRLVDEFCAAGGEAIEVSYSNLNPDVLKNLAVICHEKSLWASVGSDFHSPDNTWMEMGRIRRLPEICRDRAIWLHPRWARLARPVEAQT